MDPHATWKQMQEELVAENWDIAIELAEALLCIGRYNSTGTSMMMLFSRFADQYGALWRTMASFGSMPQTPELISA